LKFEEFRCGDCVCKLPYNWKQHETPMTLCGRLPEEVEVAIAHKCWYGFKETRNEQARGNLEAQENCR